MTLPLVQGNNPVKYCSNSQKGLGVMPQISYCQFYNNYVYSDLDLWPLTLDQGHDTSLDPGKLSCELLKFIKRVRSYGSDKLYACLNHYVYSDLDLGPVTFSQGLDTSLGPV
jgi:hypothetical protein